MNNVFRHSALALTVSAFCNLSFAANHPASFGVYRTAVQEDRLFIEDGTVLRCDLFFSSELRNDEVVAPKGSRVSQSVPPFVWQYSGLLPVSDYLKTAAIHSAGSREKERAWQDVQLTFYEGLRAEGAREFEAKVAYAGAYAFAPRWPLVEFIDITDPVRDKHSRLYQVEYIVANPKGVTIEEYRSLVMDIEANSGDISLQDIRGVIDAADAARALPAEDDTWLKRIWRNEAPIDAKSKTGAMTEAPQEAADKAGSDELAAQKKAVPEAKSAENTMVGSANNEATAEPGVVVDIPDQSRRANEMFAVPEVTAGELIGVEVMVEDLQSASKKRQDMLITDELGEIDGEPGMKEEGVSEVIIDSEVPRISSGSVSDQLAAADKEVLLGVGGASEKPEQEEYKGVAVDLDAIEVRLMPVMVPDDMDKPAARDGDVREAEEELWEPQPDGSELLKL